ncbi:preprotein translocase subunit SecE [Desulfococcaceae bacterium HSG8]|nr:preprotein translocase subunit SecE [Desulfococcaceae bacterium HSG8]
MGRLLRKKSSIRKKKRQENGSVSSSQINGDAADKTPDARKKGNESYLQRKSAGTGKRSLFSTGYLGKGLQFLREVKAELKKVTWPSRKQTIGSTVVVIILVMIISFFLGVVDIGLNSLVRLVLQ